MPVNIFIVDDSATVRMALKMILEKDPDICVLGVAATAEIALRKMANHWPDVIVSDLEMPGMHGLDFLRYLNEYRPTPFVVCSTQVGPGAKASIDALALGAVDIIAKPNIALDACVEEISVSIAQAVKAAAQTGRRIPARPAMRTERPLPEPPVRRGNPKAISVIAIGSSTGGTNIVESILKSLTPDMPGVLVVQHMPKHFTELFARRLDSLCAIDVKEAVDGDVIRHGLALIAPGGLQMKLAKLNHRLVVNIVDDAAVNRHKPSADVLFHSVAQQAGSHALGIILTGMGDDGANGLLAMRNAGAVTVGQDQASSAVYGMPRVAMEIGAVVHQLPAADIPDFIRRLPGGLKT